jgi:uncharacterized surface protein with fasciclin (FAS1) repeats
MLTSMKLRRTLAVAAAASVAVLGGVACSQAEEATTGSGQTTTAQQQENTGGEETTTSAGDTADPAANLVGPGCAGYAEQVPTGPGSVEGMAQDPVATAASNNPMLSTLVAAVSGQVNPEVNLVDTLNGDEFTVFAPTNDAFAKIDAATMETLKTDADLLNTILTYHVVPGQMNPDEIEGTHATVQGAEVEVSGSGDELKVNDANVVCGGVQTANATVYMIDSVLMPPEQQ